jgi:hypothetical protein
MIADQFQFVRQKCSPDSLDITPNLSSSKPATGCKFYHAQSRLNTAAAGGNVCRSSQLVFKSSLRQLGLGQRLRNARGFVCGERGSEWSPSAAAIYRRKKMAPAWGAEAKLGLLLLGSLASQAATYNDSVIHTCPQAYLIQNAHKN